MEREREKQRSNKLLERDSTLMLHLGSHLGGMRDDGHQDVFPLVALELVGLQGTDMRRSTKEQRGESVERCQPEGGGT